MLGAKSFKSATWSPPPNTGIDHGYIHSGRAGTPSGHAHIDEMNYRVSSAAYYGRQVPGLVRNISLDHLRQTGYVGAPSKVVGHGDSAYFNDYVRGYTDHEHDYYGPHMHDFDLYQGHGLDFV